MRCIHSLTVALALSCVTPAFAGDLRVVIRGTVTQLTGVMPAPYQLTTPGSPMVLTLEAVDTPTILIPGVSRSYPLEDERSALELGIAAAPLFPGFVAGSITIDNDLLPPNLPSPFDSISIHAAVNAGAAGILPLVTSIQDASAQALPTDDAAALAQAGYAVPWPSSATGDLFLYNCWVRVERVEFLVGSISEASCPATSTNAAGEYARLDAFGSRLVPDGDVSLVASELPPQSNGYFLCSMTPGFTHPPSSAGTLCLGGSIGRFVGAGEIFTSTASGTATLSLDLTRLPQPTGFVAAAPGQTWYFQAWYRQPLPPPQSSHLTGATAVRFE